MNFSTPEKSTISSNFLFDLLPCHPQNGAVEVDILPPGQFGVEAGAHFEQTGDAAMEFDAAISGVGDAGEDFEEGTLACPIATNDAHYFAALDFKGDVLQCPDDVFGVVAIFAKAGQLAQAAQVARRVAQLVQQRPGKGVVLLFFGANAVTLAQILNTDSNIRHRLDTIIRKRSLPSETFEVLTLYSAAYSTAKLQKSVGG